MTTYLLAGGGTSGHVNPLLSVASSIVESDPDATIIVVGTREGLESRLVPAAGFELVTIPRVPFPRRPGRYALVFPFRFWRSVRQLRRLCAEREVDVVVGFGGYASTPAYVAARGRIPLVVHEANALPGLANRLGARWTRFVGVTFAGTALPHARLVGMPLRREVESIDKAADRSGAAAELGLDPLKPVLLVTSGSLGSLRVNEAIVSAAESIVAAGWQVVHVGGSANPVPDPGLPGYRMFDYLDRMDLALAVADFAVARAGAATVSELAALGIPAVYVPLPFGNGEQRLNAEPMEAAGGALIVDDANFTAAWVDEHLLPLLADSCRVSEMASAAGRSGFRDGSAKMVALIHDALASAAYGR